jgi:hypothetical protein
MYYSPHLKRGSQTKSFEKGFCAGTLYFGGVPPVIPAKAGIHYSFTNLPVKLF